jgi:hypothetical protein
LQTLRIGGAGLPFKRPSGLQGLGDAVLLLRIAFPDRLGVAEEELLYGCLGESLEDLQLVRSTAVLLSGVHAGWADHDVQPWPGLHVFTPARDPLTSAVARWAWYGP